MFAELFAQSSSDDDSRWSGTARLINCFREPSGSGLPVIKQVLGQEPYAKIPGVFAYAAEEIAGKAYICHGGAAWLLNSKNSVERLGAVPNDPHSSIAGNNGKVVFAAGGVYSVWDGLTMAHPTPAAFANIGSVSFFKHLTVLTERNGRRIQWSNVADPMLFDGSYATAETFDDNILRAVPVGDALWVMKETSIERWFFDGTNMRAMPGGVIATGLSKFQLMATLPNGLFFIGHDGLAYYAGGGGVPERVSNVAVETALDQGEPETVIYYQDEGHKFCCIVFKDRPAWCLDLGTGEWSERSEGRENCGWSARACVGAYGEFYTIDELGAVSILKRSAGDKGNSLISTAISKTIDFGHRNRRRVTSFEIGARVGSANKSNQPPYLSEPQLVLQLSGDHGHQWGREYLCGLGRLGEHDTKVVYYSLGQFASVTFKLVYSEPFDLTIATSANLEVV